MISYQLPMNNDQLTNWRTKNVHCSLSIVDCYFEGFSIAASATFIGALFDRLFLLSWHLSHLPKSTQHYPTPLPRPRLRRRFSPADISVGLPLIIGGCSGSPPGPFAGVLLPHAPFFLDNTYYHTHVHYNWCCPFLVNIYININCFFGNKTRMVRISLRISESEH